MTKSGETGADEGRDDGERAGDADRDSESGPASTVETYYEALDDRDYGRLESVLAPGFTQRRPDRTFEGREAFVRFMRDERPMTDTSHELLDVLVDETSESDRVTVRGQLRDGDGDVVFGFADVFTLEDGRLVRLETYTR